MTGNFLFVLLSSIIGLIPAPAQYTALTGTYDLGETVTVFIQSNDAEINPLCEYLALDTPFKTDIVENPDAASVSICIDSSLELPDEGYAMKVGPEGIDIHASTVTGAFYAFMNILQLSRWGQTRQIECCEINDAPQYSYRGLHVDVSRHFRSKEFLMKQMDAMALFKLNKMHLHLTDGAGWRIQIDKYPRLTQYAAWRPQRAWTDWIAAEKPYCEMDSPEAYGGYYTKDDIREILDYAALRHIEVIPEIELPGHSEEVLAAYPELRCNVQGYTGDLCPGKEETFTFLENVLAEVIDLFPSQYIHIGGDEADKTAWKECDDCQRRMREEGLQNVFQLQSYMIHRIEKFVNSKGRKDVGWDEILEGGLAPNAIVMTWRSIEAGLIAARMGHDVIMTPSSYCYLDYYQDAPFKEPEAIGGYLPLAKTYSFNLPDVSDIVIPQIPGLNIDQMGDEDVQSHILGVQGNLWVEYVTEDSHAEYMYYPRALAIAENGWSGADKKDYDDFRDRALDALETLRYMGYTTFNLAEEYGDRPESKIPVENLATGCPVTYFTRYSRNYTAGGDTALTDGARGGWAFGDGRWQGFNGSMEVVIDLQELRDIHRIEATFLNNEGAWINLPKTVEFSISKDGENYETVSVEQCQEDIYQAGTFFSLYGTDLDSNARYVKVNATKSERYGTWVFTDEIIVK